MKMKAVVEESDLLNWCWTYCIHKGEVLDKW